MSKRRLVTYTFSVKDKETGTQVLGVDATFKLTPAEEKGPLFAAKLVEMESELINQFFSTKWEKKVTKKKASSKKSTDK